MWKTFTYSCFHKNISNWKVRHYSEGRKVLIEYENPIEKNHYFYYTKLSLLLPNAQFSFQLSCCTDLQYSISLVNPRVEMMLKNQNII